MNSYFQKATERYKEKGSLIAPISIIDAQIITEIVDFFKMIKNDGMVQALRQWKFLKDEEILNLVLRCKKDFVDNDEKTTEPETRNGISITTTRTALPKQRNFIEFCDNIFDLEFVVQIQRFEVASYIGNVIYKIVINPTTEQKMMYANTHFVFPNEEVRDNNWNMLKEKLTEFNIKFV